MLSAPQNITTNPVKQEQQTAEKQESKIESLVKRLNEQQLHFTLIPLKPTAPFSYLLLPMC